MSAFFAPLSSVSGLASSARAAGALRALLRVSASGVARVVVVFPSSAAAAVWAVDLADEHDESVSVAAVARRGRVVVARLWPGSPLPPPPCGGRGSWCGVAPALAAVPPSAVVRSVSGPLGFALRGLGLTQLTPDSGHWQVASGASRPVWRLQAACRAARLFGFLPHPVRPAPDWGLLLLVA